MARLHHQDTKDTKSRYERLRIRTLRRFRRAGWESPKGTHGRNVSREFRLPAGLDTEKIEAGLADGVLTVRLPRAESAKPRKIAVKAG